MGKRLTQASRLLPARAAATWIRLALVALPLLLVLCLAGSSPLGAAFLARGPDPAAAELSPSRGATAPLGQWVIFEDHFETVTKWVVDPDGTDTARAGLWERAIPKAVSDMYGNTQIVAYDGQYDLVTDSRSGSPDQYDVDEGITTICSPQIALPRGSWDSIDLSFQYYLAHRTDSSTTDGLQVRVVGSASATVLEEYGSGDNDNAAWALFEDSISGFVGQAIRVCVLAGDGFPESSVVEAGFDAVKIVGNESVPPSSTASSPDCVGGGTIPVSWTASDSASGLANICLYHKYAGGPWTSSGLCTTFSSAPPSASGTFTFSPASGDGIYAFKTVATDVALNSEPAAADPADTETAYGSCNVYLPAAVRAYSPLTNGSYEYGWTGWTHGGDIAQTVTTADSYEGSHAALLGDPGLPCAEDVAVGGTAWAEQTFSVPTSGVSALVVQYKVVSFDKFQGDDFDRFEIWVNDTRVWSDGNTSANYGTCQGGPWTADWEVFQLPLASYLGENITLRLVDKLHPDRWFNTWTYVDDIRFLP